MNSITKHVVEVLSEADIKNRVITNDFAEMEMIVFQISLFNDNMKIDSAITIYGRTPSLYDITFKFSTISFLPDDLTAYTRSKINELNSNFRFFKYVLDDENTIVAKYDFPPFSNIDNFKKNVKVVLFNAKAVLEEALLNFFDNANEEETYEDEDGFLPF